MLLFLMQIWDKVSLLGIQGYFWATCQVLPHVLPALAILSLD